jgi:adenine-specific DNA-methyltransferase
MERRAAEQGDVHFYELGALGVAARVEQGTVTLRLTDFLMPLESVPDEVQKTVTHWSQWIDYWAVDWDHQGDTFHNMWQAYRTKAAPKLPLEAVREGTPPGRYRVVVKVMDLLGNDTTRVLDVEVAP